MGEKTKKCSLCGHILPIYMFSRDNRRNITHRANCKLCDRKRRRKYTLTYNEGKEIATEKKNSWLYTKKFGKDKHKGWVNFKK